MRALPFHFPLLPLAALALALFPRTTVHAQSLPGLTITGNQFAYNAPDGPVTGIFLKPPGEGPFPAILVSHGKGGNSTGFSLNHANTFVRWGFVCIGPNYTHANTGSTPDDEGYSPENSRRARRALEILAATPGVDMTRLAAFSHSMGSFLTAGLLGELPTTFRAAAIAAGGTSGTATNTIPSPSTSEVADIRTPLLMFHGTNDTTVIPQQSAALQSILSANNVPHRRLLYQGVNHNIIDQNIRRADAYAVTRAWFTQHGVLPAPGNTAPTISAPAAVSAVPGVASGPLALTIADAETPAASLLVEAFSLDADVPAAPQSAAYLGKLPNSGLVLSGTGATRTLTITPRAAQSGSVEVVLVVSEPATANALAALTFLRVDLGEPATTIPASTGDASLVNLSARANVTAADPLIAGFVITGTGTRDILIRAIGPTLATFDVPGSLPDPRLQLYRGDTPTLANDDWSATNPTTLASTAASAGAFALPAGSRDAALLVTLAPGQYSAHAQAAAGTGIALVEIYDTGGDPAARLANLSVRTRPEPASGALIVGFVIHRPGARALLVRGVGPSLANFGVVGALADPQLQLYSGSTTLLSNNDWATPAGPMLMTFATAAGAFPLDPASRDAALGLALSAGSYSAVLSSANTTATGVALIELYSL